MRSFRTTIVAVGKAVTITYSECLSAALLSSVQCACGVLCFRFWPVWLQHIFPHYLINCTIFRGKNRIIKHVLFLFCSVLFLFFSTNFVWNISRSKKNSEIFYRRSQTSSCKVRFYWTSKFLNKFLKSTQQSNFIKIRPLGAELFHADGPTDTHHHTTPFWPPPAHAS